VARPGWLTHQIVLGNSDTSLLRGVLDMPPVLDLFEDEFGPSMFRMEDRGQIRTSDFLSFCPSPDPAGDTKQSKS
jgi:hypothetical protein